MKELLYIAASLWLSATCLAAQKKSVQEQQEQQEHEEYLLDTTNDESGGNWFIKKKITAKAHTLYETFAPLGQQVATAAQYYEENRPIQKDKQRLLELPLRFTLAELQAEAAKAVSELQKKAEPLEGYPEHSEKFLALRASIDELESFGKTIAFILQADANLDKVVIRAQEVVKQVNEYIETAWKNIQEMDAILDHEKARFLHDEIESHYEHAQLLENQFLKGELKQYFEKTSQYCLTELQKITAQLAEFQKKGLLPIKETEEEKRQKLAAQEKLKQKQEVSKSLWYKLLSVLVAPLRWVQALFLYLAALFFGIKVD
jgi:hypothetical protein